MKGKERKRNDAGFREGDVIDEQEHVEAQRNNRSNDSNMTLEESKFDRWIALVNFER